MHHRERRQPSVNLPGPPPDAEPPQETKKRFLRQVQAAKALIEERARSRREPDEADETEGLECGQGSYCEKGFVCLNGRCVEPDELPDEANELLRRAERNREFKEQLREAEARAIERAMVAEARAREKMEAAKQEAGTNDP